MSTVFSAPKQGIVVLQEADGSLSWSGQYNGVSVHTAIPIDGAHRCILLLDPDVNQCSAFENLLCIDEEGHTLWVAKLPSRPDVFVRIVKAEEGIWTNTWSGYRVLIDQRSGDTLKATFVK